MKEQFENYAVEGFFDEAFAREDHSVRGVYDPTVEFFGDYFDAQPLKGIFLGTGSQKLYVQVDVERM